MYIYLDESGDLGYTLDKPYRDGGSSQYMTIAYMLVPVAKAHIPIRKVRKLYKKDKINTQREKKGSELSVNQRKYFCNSVIEMLKEHPEIKIGAITVSKCNVNEKMRVDQNILYNFMIKLATISRICNEDVIFMVPDKKPIKIKDINQCKEYLQSELVKIGSKTQLEYEQQESHENDNLIFIDWICNTIWKYYEDKDETGYSILNVHLESDEKLFFSKQVEVEKVEK